MPATDNGVKDSVTPLHQVDIYTVASPGFRMIARRHLI